MTVAIRNFKGFFVFAAFLFVFSMLLTAYTSKHPEIAKFGKVVINQIERPALLFVDYTSSSISSLFSNYFFLVGTKKENQHLEERIKVLEAHNSKLLEYAQENKNLKQLLNFQRSFSVKGVVANVVSSTALGLAQKLIIDQGFSSGIEVNDIVVDGNALVGQVSTVSTNMSEILLVSDPASGVDALAQDNRARGVIKGKGSSSLSWDYVIKEENIRVGDRIITSGLDGVFPKGILVGIVTKVKDRFPANMFYSVDVKPAVNFNKLESVLVFKKQNG